jgi:periplasmic protein TonB
LVAARPREDVVAPEGPSIRGAGDGTGVDRNHAGQILGSGLSSDQRQALLRQYQEMLRNRVAARIEYPAEAEWLGLRGQVIVRISVEASGRLAGAQVEGRCLHRILCDDALRTLRGCAPFPPPPTELHPPIAIDLPLTYELAE